MPPSNETTTSVFIRGFKCGLVWSILLNSKANCFCASELSIKKCFCESLEVFCKNWCLAKTYSAVQILLFYNWVKNFWRITVKKLLFSKHFEQNSPVSQYLFQTIFCANRQPKYCLVILHLVNTCIQSPGIPVCPYCLNFDAIDFLKWNIKRKFIICCGAKLKRKSMENVFLWIGKFGKKSLFINNMI